LEQCEDSYEAGFGIPFGKCDAVPFATNRRSFRGQQQADGFENSNRFPLA
jgi:hypothetical protein